MSVMGEWESKSIRFLRRTATKLKTIKTYSELELASNTTPLAI